MFPTVLALCVAPPPADLAALGAFAGFTRDAAVANRDTAAAHKDKVLSKLPEDARRWAWECRQETVWYAWQFLADALDEGAPPHVRARNLANLKGRIGESAYYRGAMPAPVPDYGAFPPVPKD